MGAHLRQWSLVVVAAAMAAGCSGDRSRTEAAYGPPSPTSGVTLASAPRVLPGGTTTVIVTATLSGTLSGVRLRFTGDPSWPNADLPLQSRQGDRYTFGATLTAPMQIGAHVLTWRFALADGSPFGSPVEGHIEVTCSDGTFCNGEERLTSRGCVPGPPPCDDHVACTADTCDEARRTCAYDPAGPQCDECDSGNCQRHCGPHQQCGDDRCGGKCTSASTDAAGNCLGGKFCVDEVCQSVSLPGTCTNPLPLFGAAGTAVPDTGLVTTVFGDSSAGIDALKVSCGGDGIKELIYRFDVAVPMGVEIRMLSASGDPDALDTVLALHRDDCVTQGPWPGFCSDDASPPGGLGSRVYGPLEPGSYRLIATGYSASQVGAFQLQIKFVPDCVPVCDGRFCGSDGCAGECGACEVGQECSAAGRCFTSPCTPACSSRQCGDDGCGGECGVCPTGDLCAEADGRCVPANTCDHLQPVCKHCNPKSYCGSDCQCHKVNETLVDLIPAPAEIFLPTIEFQWRTFEATSCSINEGCVPGPGRYLLMRFNTDVINQGLAGFMPGDPTQEPDIFTYDECHQHYHFSGFANFKLLSLDGSTVMTGRKLSYCMEDSFRYLSGPDIPCTPRSTCDNQGIQAGWADSYPAALDCQWMVLRGTTPSPTDVPLGHWYLHETCTNVGRVFQEHSFDNNCMRVPVYIPDVPDDGHVIHYTDVTPPPMP